MKLLILSLVSVLSINNSHAINVWAVQACEGKSGGADCSFRSDGHKRTGKCGDVSIGGGKSAFMCGATDAIAFGVANTGLTTAGALGLSSDSIIGKSFNSGEITELTPSYIGTASINVIATGKIDSKRYKLKCTHAGPLGTYKVLEQVR